MKTEKVKRVYSNVRKLYSDVNENLQSIGVNDYAKTLKFPFYDVAFKENGGDWKLYQTKDKSYILTVSDKTGIVAEVHYHIIDENNGALETTLFYFKPREYKFNLLFSHLNIFELKRARLDFIKVINQYLATDNFKLIDVSLDLTADSMVIGKVTFNSPAHWLPRVTNVLIHAGHDFDEKVGEQA